MEDLNDLLGCDAYIPGAGPARSDRTSHPRPCWCARGLRRSTIRRGLNRASRSLQPSLAGLREKVPGGIISSGSLSENGLKNNSWAKTLARSRHDLTWQITGDGLIAPELDFDIGLCWPGGPRLVVAVPARVGDPELLHQAGQLAKQEHAPVIGPGLIIDSEPGSESHGGEAVGVGDAGLVRGSVDSGSWACAMFSARPRYHGDSPSTK